MKLRVASYNIHKAVGTDRRRDPDRIITVLREINADIIALQEADTRFGTRTSVLSKAALDDTPWKAVPLGGRTPSLGWHGNALLFRRSMEVAEADHLELPTLEPRGAVRADIVVGEQRVRIVGMHLDLSGLRRRHQIRSVLNQLDACEPHCPAIVMGDFNQWGNTTGAMREFGQDWHVLDTGRSFPSRQPIARLDRIVISAGSECNRAGVHRTATSSQASDHLPIFAELVLPDK
ncbi:MAG: endonuclease/exonuclease/phosphatase family protein [Pontixanthobacter sp.]